MRRKSIGVYPSTRYLLTYLVHRDGRAEGSFGPPSVFANVNLVPLLWTGVPTPSAPADRQDPLPIFRCPGNAFVLRWVFPDHLITF